MHIVQMVKRYRRRFQQGGAGNAVREIAISKRFRTHKQIVQRTKLIHQTARQWLGLNTYRAHHFTTTQTFLRARFVFHL
ncbi:hypothetical protein SRABI106_04318 [Rahnella aquatilis]|nr:hypothetical protein SRABI106_04318 [Rahnella aquatilis]